MGRQNVLRIVYIFAILLALLYGSAPLILPKPSPASVQAESFSAERAMAHVQYLGKFKRVAGSPGMDQAVAYLLTTLQACGLNPQIQDAVSSQGMLHNVIVYLGGSNPGKAVLIVTHVDSISYGAGDNASGTAVLLEAACNLQAGKLLKNGLILLFEDGEEQGYLGGYAFVKYNPSLFTVRRVIGLDTAAWGPVVLLQTTPGNADFIHAYAASIHSPTAFGFFADADWTISHDDSELQPFYEQDIPGLELEDPTAFTGKHSDADTPEHVRSGSLQQMGDQVLELATQLGNSDLSNTSLSDRSYFTFWGIGVVNYPAGWNMVLSVLSGIGVIVLIVKEIQQKSFSLRNLILSVLLSFLVVIGAAAFGAAGSAVFGKLFPNPNPQTGSYLVPASLPYFLVSLLVVGVASLIIQKKLIKSLGSTAVYLGVLMAWLCFSFLLSFLLPVGSYIITIPLILAICVSFLPRNKKWLWSLPAIVAAILLSPNIVLAYLGAGLQALAIVTLLLALNVEIWAEVD
jgi:hypothetical protein